MDWKSRVTAISAGCFAVALGAGPAHAAPPDACKLLSQAQINSVLGINVDEAKPSKNKSCHWEAPTGKTRKGVSLALQSPSQASAEATAPGGHHIAQTPSRQTTKILPDGFRGDAYYVAMPEVGGVKVPKGSSILQIRVYGFPVDQAKTKEKILADCVIETLTNGRFQGGCPV